MLGSRSYRERPVTNTSNWVTTNFFITEDTTFAMYVFEEGHVRVTNSSFSTSVSPDMIVLPFNRCHDCSQYSPSPSLSASFNGSAVIFKRFADTALSFFHRFFQPHFLIINVPAFVARAKFFGPHRAKFFCTITLCRSFFGRGKQAGSLPSLSHVFHETYPSITRELVSNRSISHFKTSGPSYVT